MSISVLHQTARKFAQAGIKVFPCIPRTKISAVEDWANASTTDLAQIDAWWSQNGSYNLATPPAESGWTVVDEEAGTDPAWTEGRPLPETYTVVTPGGGTHKYYEGECRSTVKKLGPTVDTRGVRKSGDTQKHGYVLLPPSVFYNEKTGKTGIYKVLNNVEIAPLPRWIPETLTKVSEKAEAPAGIKQDDPGNIMRAIRHLKTLPPVKQGEGSDDAAFKAAAVMRDLGLSQLRATATMMEHFKCEPKDLDWVQVKVANAYKHAENEPAAYASPPMAESFAGALATQTKVAEVRSRFYFEDDDEMDLTNEPNWIVKDLIPENSIVLLTAKKGSFKTFIAMDLAMAIATGTETFGIVPTITGPTMYGAHEGIHHIKKTHRKAWRLAKDIKGVTDFYVARGPRVGSPEDCEEFGKAIIDRCGKRNPRLIVLDTYSACMLGLDENSPGDANRFIAYCRDLIDRFPGCSVLVPAHFGKDDSRGTRGSNALEAGVDTVLEMYRVENTRMVSVRVKNQRGAPERELPYHFEGQVLAGSLVFNPIAPADFAKKTQREFMTGKDKVGAALVKLKARSREKGITSRVLANELTPMAPTESVEEWTKRVGDVARQLEKASVNRLEAYCERNGREVTWYLPPAQE